MTCVDLSPLPLAFCCFEKPFNSLEQAVLMLNNSSFKCHNKSDQNLHLLVQEEEVVVHHSKKSNLVGVRFAPEEKLKLKELADEQKINLSELLRAIALQQIERTNRRFVPEVNRKLYFELGQVSEKLQTSQISSEMLHKLQDLLNQVRTEFLGLSS